MVELVIKIDEQTYNNFVRNGYSRADVIAMHTAIVNGTPLEEAPENQKTGHWIKEWYINHYEYVCSECDCGEDSQTHYCPSCGAKMEGESNE